MSGQNDSISCICISVGKRGTATVEEPYSLIAVGHDMSKNSLEVGARIKVKG